MNIQIKLIMMEIGEYLTNSIYSILQMNYPKIDSIFTSIFTLSSHHPYTIPTQHQGKFPKGELEIHESIGYVDYALKRFFEKAQQQPWYANTVFILTADHTAQTANPAYKNRTGIFKVPFIISNYSDSAGVISSAVQQTDFIPLALDLSGFSGDAIFLAITR